MKWALTATSAMYLMYLLCMKHSKVFNNNNFSPIRSHWNMWPVFVQTTVWPTGPHPAPRPAIVICKLRGAPHAREKWNYLFCSYKLSYPTHQLIWPAVFLRPCSVASDWCRHFSKLTFCWTRKRIPKRYQYCSCCSWGFVIRFSKYEGF